mmetsp:Transcript_117464/g.337009  ORF Transcript_117464/g.337009 Transcript_117464/m.337009 type:complete len:239 (+) Transcript_117464:93-809(+)
MSAAPSRHIVWGHANTSSDASGSRQGSSSSLSGRRDDIEFRDESGSGKEGGTDGDESTGVDRRFGAASPDFAGNGAAFASTTHGKPGGPGSAAASSGGQQQPHAPATDEKAQPVRVEHPFNDDMRPILTRRKLWSAGSERHILGECKACHYIHSTHGCSQGETCEFCHIPHSHTSHLKVGMNRRRFCRSFAKQVVAECKDHGDVLERWMGPLTSRSDFLHSVFLELTSRPSRPNIVSL